MKGIIFDFDGTLADSLVIWEDLGHRYLLQKGRKPEENLKDKLEAMSQLQAAVYMKETYGLMETPEEIVGGLNKIMEKFYLEEVTMKPGAADLVKKVRELKVPMVIATASERYLVEGALKLNDLEGVFGAILTCGEVGQGKSSPVIYEKAADFLGFDHEDLLVIEDAYYAASTAKTAGFEVWGVYDPYSYHKRDPWDQTADQFLMSIEEAWALIEARK